MYTLRSNQQLIIDSFNRPFVTAILGPRRTGKSTLVQEFSKQFSAREWQYLNLDTQRERDKLKRHGLKALIETWFKRPIDEGQKMWVAIDEVQKYPNIFDEVKEIYDLFKEKNKIKFILTGSSRLELYELSSESLAGRIELYQLKEFNLYEDISFNQLIEHDVEAPSLLDVIFNLQESNLKQNILARKYYELSARDALNKQLIWGGLPEALQANSKEDKIRYLGQYLQTYIEKDVRAIKNIENIDAYQALLEVVAEQTGAIRNETKLKNAVGISTVTLKKYLGYLSATLIYKELLPHIDNSMKRLVKSPKIYLLNNGVISYISGINDIDLMKKTGMVGQRFENWFLKELDIALERYPEKSAVRYWRTSNGAEVDFVVVKKPHVFPFEVTYSTQIQRKKIKNLRSFMEEETRAPIGFYIYMGDYHYDEKLNIHFIPAWAIS